MSHRRCRSLAKHPRQRNKVTKKVRVGAGGSRKFGHKVVVACKKRPIALPATTWLRGQAWPCHPQYNHGFSLSLPHSCYSAATSYLSRPKTTKPFNSSIAPRPNCKSTRNALKVTKMVTVLALIAMPIPSTVLPMSRFKSPAIVPTCMTFIVPYCGVVLHVPPWRKRGIQHAVLTLLLNTIWAIPVDWIVDATRGGTDAIERNCPQRLRPCLRHSCRPHLLRYLLHSWHWNPRRPMSRRLPSLNPTKRRRLRTRRIGGTLFLPWVQSLLAWDWPWDY